MYIWIDKIFEETRITTAMFFGTAVEFFVIGFDSAEESTCFIGGCGYEIAYLFLAIWSEAFVSIKVEDSLCGGVF